MPGLLGALTLPAPTVHSVRYRLQRRTDWDVLVYRGVRMSYPPVASAHVEHSPSRADELGEQLARENHLPV